MTMFRHSRWSALFGFLITLLVVSVGNARADIRKQFVVTDCKSKKPISGARIHALDALVRAGSSSQGTTGAEGFAQLFPLRPGGTHRFKISAKGYRTKTTTAEQLRDGITKLNQVCLEPDGDDPRDTPPPRVAGEELNDKVIEIRYRFYAAKKVIFSKQNRRRWVKAIQWWVKNINKNCDGQPKIDSVKDLGNDRKSLPPRKVRFATKAVKLKKAGRRSWLVGKARLKGLIGKTASTRDFHIGVFKQVKAKPQTKRGSGSVPGQFVSPNVIAVKVNAKLHDKRHEMGHLFGLEDGDGGIMTKNYQKKPGTSGFYGGQIRGRGRKYSINSWVGKYWCSKIARHLGI